MRLIARFAMEIEEGIEIIDVFDKDIKRNIAKDFKIKTLTKQYPSAIWMERKIADEFGVVFEGSFDTRPLIKHEWFPKNIYPLRKNFNQKKLNLVNMSLINMKKLVEMEYL